MGHCAVKVMCGPRALCYHSAERRRFERKLDRMTEIHRSELHEREKMCTDSAKNVLLMLLRSSAAVDALDFSTYGGDVGLTPLCIAVQHGNVAATSILLANRAHVNIVADRWGARPLHVAASQGHLELTKMLLAQQADVHAKDHTDQPPCHCSASASVLQLLLSARSDIHSLTCYGETPLHRAAKYGKRDLVVLLLEAGVNAGHAKHSGKTAADMARYARQPGIAKLIESWLMGKGAPSHDELACAMHAYLVIKAV